LVVLSHLTLLVMRPRRYVAAARFYFGQPRKRRLKYFLQAGYLVRALERVGLSHLHAHFANVPTTVAELVHRLSGITYSFTAHAKDIYLTPDEELARKIKGATCVLTCTAYNHRYLKALSQEHTPIHLAYHGVDVGRFQNVGSQADRDPADVPLILSVGRFCEKKGLPYLLEACRTLKDRGRVFYCQIIGYGELQSKLEAMITDLDLSDCVALPGRMTQERLIEVYRQASMFVLPCLVTDDGDRDGIPNVLIEAMISRVPVVSTNVSGISELVDHMENGLLVEQRDPEGLAAAMELLLERSDLRRRLAENGQNKVLRQFTQEGGARRVYEILSRTISETPVTDCVPSGVPAEVGVR
jgi:glycosyltransferase involved in cell wall biosynthesis